MLAGAAGARRGRLELVVVVDGSTDGSAQAAPRRRVPRFRPTVVEQPTAGAAAARNNGAARAPDEVLLFLDDDMPADPDLVREHARLHRDGADAVIGDTPIDLVSPPGFLPKASRDGLRRPA